MERRYRWVVALIVAAVVFAAVVWFDAKVLHDAQKEAAAQFEMSGFLWLASLGAFAVAAAAIIFGGLAWWSRSLLVSAVFLIAGLAETFVQPIVFSNLGPQAVRDLLSSWLIGTSGTLGAAMILGAALAVAGFVGLIAWSRRERPLRAR